MKLYKLFEAADTDNEKPKFIKIGWYTFELEQGPLNDYDKTRYNLVSERFYSKIYNKKIVKTGFHDDDEFGTHNKAYMAAIEYCHRVETDIVRLQHHIVWSYVDEFRREDTYYAVVMRVLV